MCTKKNHSKNLCCKENVSYWHSEHTVNTLLALCWSMWRNDRLLGDEEKIVSVIFTRLPCDPLSSRLCLHTDKGPAPASAGRQLLPTASTHNWGRWRHDFANNSVWTQNTRCRLLKTVSKVSVPRSRFPLAVTHKLVIHLRNLHPSLPSSSTQPLPTQGDVEGEREEL